MMQPQSFLSDYIWSETMITDLKNPKQICDWEV